MSIIHKIDIDASKEAVFALYEDVKSWSLWDSETEAVHLAEGLRPGAEGWLKPRKGPKARIVVSEVVQGRSFTVLGLLPFCQMHFGHELESKGTRTTVTHWVRFTGPLAFLFRLMIGSGIDATLPNTLIGLKRASENTGAGA